MYRQRRRKLRNWIPAAIAATATALAVLLLLGYLGRNNDEPYKKVNSTANIYQQEEHQNSGSDADEESAPVDDENAGDEKAVFQAYYLVKYDKDRIYVYYSDKSGKITELEETTIVYEILSEDDQKRFEDGVKLESWNELNRLLMDYES